MLTKPLDMYAHAASSVLPGAKAQENKAHISSMPIKNPFHMKGSRHTTKVVGFLFQRKKQAVRSFSRSAPQERVSHMNEKTSLKKNNEKAKNNTSSFQSKTHASFSKNASTEKKSLVSTELFAEDMQNIPLLAKCISFIMKKGQKAKAASTMNTVLRMLQDLSPQKKQVVHALDMIHVAINNVKPAFELRKARFGGRTQFIPATLPVHKQENQALRALVQTARMKHKKASHTNKHHDMYTFAYFLAQEIYDAYKHQGAACQAKHGTHKQAEQYRNHVRRRWW